MQEQVNRNSTKAMRAQTIKKENGHQTREACTIAPFLLFAQKAIVLNFFHFASALTETRASLDPPQFSIVFAQPFNPASQTDSLNQLSVIRVQQIQP